MRLASALRLSRLPAPAATPCVVRGACAGGWGRAAGFGAWCGSSSFSTPRTLTECCPVCWSKSHLQRVWGLGSTHQRHQSHNAQGPRQHCQPLGAPQALPRRAVGGGTAGVQLPRLDGAARGGGDQRGGIGQQQGKGRTLQGCMRRPASRLTARVPASPTSAHKMLPRSELSTMYPVCESRCLPDLQGRPAGRVVGGWRQAAAGGGRGGGSFALPLPPSLPCGRLLGGLNSHRATRPNSAATGLEGGGGGPDGKLLSGGHGCCWQGLRAPL